MMRKCFLEDLHKDPHKNLCDKTSDILNNTAKVNAIIYFLKL